MTSVVLKEYMVNIGGRCFNALRKHEARSHRSSARRDLDFKFQAGVCQEMRHKMVHFFVAQVGTVWSKSPTLTTYVVEILVQTKFVELRRHHRMIELNDGIPVKWETPLCVGGRAANKMA